MGPLLSAAVVLVLVTPPPRALPAEQEAGTPLAQTGDGPETVRIAYPDEPDSWFPHDAGEAAGMDLSALWGLPLYRIDAHGQLRPALAERADIVPGESDEAWTVQVTLRAGSWSDGTPVTAADVVATLDAMRAAGLDVGPLTTAVAADPRTVALRFARPYARWPYLLAGGSSVLPAHVIEGAGLGAYREAVPVSGGPYRLESWEPGLRATFVAADGSPQGTPLIPTIEVWFVHGFETALGLLAAGRIDVVTGYLAVDPGPRVAEVDDVEVAAPLGGTWGLLAWADLPEDVRRAASDAVDVEALVEALFDGIAEPATSTVPGVDGPWDPAGGVPGVALRTVELTLAVPRGQEATAVLGRALDRQLRSAGGRVTLVTAEDVDDVDDAEARLVVRRDVPWPSLVGRGTDDAVGLAARLEAADAAPTPTAGAVLAAQLALYRAAAEAPLLRIGVTTVWRQGLDGVAPSSWPGVALWNAPTWHWEPAD
ncbi:MAG: ABC transporter substrate-binding protein [Nitriliruptorales bacterium]